jgi:hypothetical protein
MSENSPENLIHAKYFSLQPLPIELKDSFEIPADPDDEDDDNVELAKGFFRKHTIFFYQDDELTEGIIIEQDDGNGPIEDRHGFQAFKHSCILDMENLRVTDWEDLNDPKVKEKGPKAWLEWNKPVVIMSVRRDRVSLG